VDPVRDIEIINTELVMADLEAVRKRREKLQRDVKRGDKAAAAEDAAPGQFMRALAKKLGTEKSGAVLAYFADEKDWRVWLGDGATSSFLGRAALPADLTDGAALHDTKDVFFAAAQAEADALFARQQKSAPPDKQPPPAQHLKLQTDALLDALISKLTPR
jgi:hypothetical protein